MGQQDYPRFEHVALEQKVWALREAAKVGGFMPQAKTSVSLLHMLAIEGLVLEEDRGFGIHVWHITEAGQVFLTANDQPES